MWQIISANSNYKNAEKQILRLYSQIKAEELSADIEAFLEYLVEIGAIILKTDEKNPCEACPGGSEQKWKTPACANKLCGYRPFVPPETELFWEKGNKCYL